VSGAFILLFLFIFGLIVGSFLNVVLFRFGFAESRQSRSHCMACNALIKSYDLVPFASYVLLSGRCRSCGSALSVQYPLVELATASLFALAYQFFPASFSVFSAAAFIALLAFLACLVLVAAYDMRHTLVPIQFAAALAASAVFASASQAFEVGSFVPIADSFLGGAALSGFFFILFLITRGKGMGLGDAYIAGAVGILLGFSRGIEAVMLAVWGGTLFYLATLALSSLLAHFGLLPSRARVTMKTEVPFVPFLALGALLALFTDISPLAAAAALTQSLL
jgi:prepilin signal peptidase PulO-like enzyme (type II secretory pathway)